MEYKILRIKNHHLLEFHHFLQIERRKKDEAERIVSECLNYHSEKYPEYKNISCNLIVKTNLLIDNSCEYIVGTLKETDGKNIINLGINPDC